MSNSSATYYTSDETRALNIHSRILKDDGMTKYTKAMKDFVHLFLFFYNNYT